MKPSDRHILAVFGLLVVTMFLTATGIMLRSSTFLLSGIVAGLVLLRLAR